MNHIPIGRSNPLFRLRVSRPSRHPIRARPRVGPVSQPIELWAPGAKRPSIYVCRRCKTGYNLLLLGSDDERHAHAKWQAARCCDARCERCMAPVERYHSRCRDCQSLHLAEQRRAWAKRSRPVEYDGGWVYSEHVSGYNDGYFDSMDALVEYVEESVSDGITLPPWVIPCREIHPELDLSVAYEHMDDDFCVDDMSPSQEVSDADAKALDEIVARINDGLRSTTGYQADFSRVIILDAEAFNREFGNDLTGRPITSWSDRPPTVDPILVSHYWRRISEAQAEAIQELTP